MLNPGGFLLLTVTMVTMSALVQSQCPELNPTFGDVFTDCGPLESPEKYAMCCFRGDPHITTFDIFRYNYGRKGWFTAVVPCESGNNEIQIDVYMSPRFNGKQFRITGVRIQKDDRKYEIKFSRKSKIFKVDDVVKPLPYWDDQLVAVVSPANPNILIIRCEHVRIVINCKFHIVYIWLLSEWSLDLKMCGLCGYYNGDLTDDTSCLDNCPADCVLNSANCPMADFGQIWFIDEGPGGDGAGGGGDGVVPT